MEKINNLGYLTLKKFYTVKEIVKKMKKQPREWEKMFANHIPGEVISKIYK